jgi:hypothetical protein
VIQNLTKVVLGLSYVVVLHIQAHDKQLHDHSGPLFTAAWETFGDKLRVLSLEGELNCFWIPLSLARLPELRELRLEFADVLYERKVEANVATLCDIIVPAINKFCPILRSLSIISFSSDIFGHLDISPFLIKLHPLPLLERLAVQVPLRKLTDPSGLVRILQNHANSLRHVKLRLESDLTAPPIDLDGLRAMMQKCRTDKTIFTNLESFEFFTHPSKDSFTTLVMYLSRSADTLTSLIMLDNYLSYQELSNLTSIFSHRPASSGLRDLSLSVMHFGPHLLIQLAESLPGLKHLHLRSWDWGVCGAVSSDAPTSQKLVRYIFFTTPHAFSTYDRYIALACCFC